MRLLLAFVSLVSPACSEDSDSPRSSTPVSPTPAPTPTPPAAAPPPTVPITGTITDSVTGGVVGSFAATATTFPARVVVTAPGYVSRDTWVTSANPRVDFPERDFDLAFYRQLMRNDLDRGATPLQPLAVLAQAPAFYMEVEGAKGFSVQVAQTLEQLARRLVPELTGGRFQVTRWETGPTARPRQAGWIVIERRDQPNICGSALVGAADGQIFLDGDLQCFRIASTFAHELGHALGLWHVDRPGSMMYPRGERPDQSSTDAPTSQERHHARLAY